jgi:hypothetical protein
MVPCPDYERADHGAERDPAREDSRSRDRPKFGLFAAASRCESRASSSADRWRGSSLPSFHRSCLRTSQQPAAQAGACAAAPRTHADAVEWSGPSCHRRTRGTVTNTAQARGRRAVLVLMIHLPLAPAHGLGTPSGLSRWPKPIHGPAHWSKRAFPSADQTPHALRSPNAAESRPSPPWRGVFVTLPDMRPARGRRPGVAPRCRSSRSGRSRPHSRGRRWQAQRGRSARPGAPSGQPA